MDENQLAVNQPEISPVSPVTDKKTSLWEKLLLLLGVLIVASTTITTGYLYLQNRDLKNQVVLLQTTPTPSPTTMATPTPSPDDESAVDWKIYTNSQFKFSFKYPLDWEVKDLLPANKSLPSKEETLLFIGYAPQTVKEDIAGMVEITTRGMAEEMALYKLSFQQNSDISLKIENPIKISGINGRELVYLNKANNLEFKTWFVNFNGYTYRFSAGSSDDQTIDQITKTIQLID